MDQNKLHQPSPARSSQRRHSVKEVVLKNFGNFTRKHLCWSLFNKVAVLQAFNFIKKRLQHRCFPMKFRKSLRTPILKNIYERLLLPCYYTRLQYTICHLRVPLLVTPVMTQVLFFPYLFIFDENYVQIFIYLPSWIILACNYVMLTIKQCILTEHKLYILLNTHWILCSLYSFMSRSLHKQFLCQISKVRILQRIQQTVQIYETILQSYLQFVW